jgi:hypothetical protein
MRFYNVSVNQSVLTEANRDLISYSKLLVDCPCLHGHDIGVDMVVILEALNLAGSHLGQPTGLQMVAAITLITAPTLSDCNSIATACLLSRQNTSKPAFLYSYCCSLNVAVRRLEVRYVCRHLCKYKIKVDINSIMSFTLHLFYKRLEQPPVVQLIAAYSLNAAVAFGLFS